MKQLTSRWVALTFALGAILFLGACHKKTTPPPPPPPPPAPAPSATLTANPEAIDKGQSATLTWQTPTPPMSALMELGRYSQMDRSR
jgi:peptidoglycan-associated lipoprotein